MPDATPVSSADIAGALANVNDPASGRDPLAAGGVPAISPELQDQMLKNAEGLTERQDRYMRDEAAAYKKLPPVPTVESGKLGKIGAPPTNDIRGDAMAWLGFATALGGIAGALTKRSSMNALAAFSGALDGLQQGNQEKFNNDFKTWEAQAKATQENNKTEMDGYRNILDRTDLDHRQRADQLEMWAMQNRNKFMIELARASKNDPAMFTAALDSMETQARKGNDGVSRLVEARERARDARETAQIRAQGVRTMTDQEVTAAANTYFLTGKMPPGLARADKAAIVGAADSIREERGITPDKMTELWATRASTLQKFAGAGLGNTTRSLSVAIDHMDSLLEVAEVMNRQGPQGVNRVWNRVASFLGSEPPSTFDGARFIVAREINKSLTATGAGTEGERAQLDDMLSGAKTIDQLRDAVAFAQKLLASQTRALQRQYEQATGEKDFGEKLSPRARQLLLQPDQPYRPGAAQPAPPQGGSTAPSDPLTQRLRSYVGAARKEGHSDEDIKAFVLDQARANGWTEEQLKAALPRIMGNGNSSGTVGPNNPATVGPRT